MEVSNKTLSILVLLAIGVSLLGVLFSGPSEITGATTEATDTGVVNLSITQQTTLIFINESIDFGAGYVNATSPTDNCYLDTEGTMDGPDKCVSWTNYSEGLSLRNDGNTNLSVQINFSKTSATFINDALGGVQFKVTDDNTAGQLDDTVDSCGGNWINYTSYSDFTTTPEYICGNASDYPLGPENDKDDAIIDINITISNTATVEAKGVFIYLIGTSSE